MYKWLANWINKAMLKAKGKSGSRYLEMTSSHLSKIMNCIKEAIIVVTQEMSSNRGNWAKLFESNVKKELAVPSDLLDPETQKIQEVENFKHILLEKILELEKDVLQVFQCCDPDQIVWKGDPPIVKVMKELWGCPEHCPFCREPCQRNEGHLSDDISHSCIQHRPLCVNGTLRVHNNSLEIEPCNYKVQSDYKFRCDVSQLKCRESGNCKTTGDDLTYHSYKEYKTYLPDWDIAPNPTMEVSKYWMWFVGKYIDELVEKCDAVKPDVPESWKTISDKEALDSLRMAVE